MGGTMTVFASRGAATASPAIGRMPGVTKKTRAAIIILMPPEKLQELNMCRDELSCLILSLSLLRELE